MNLEERITALERRLADLEAAEGIRATIARYAETLDYEQFDELAAIMTEDVILKPGAWFEEQKGKENAMNIFRDYRTTFQYPHRYVANERFEIEGDTGKGSSYFLVVHSHGGGSYIGWGTYDWVFRLEEGVWKIAKMIIDIQVMTSLDKGWGMEKDRVISFPSSDD